MCYNGAIAKQEEIRHTAGDFTLPMTRRIQFAACKTEMFPHVMQRNGGYVRAIASVEALEDIGTEGVTAWVQNTTRESVTICAQSRLTAMPDLRVWYLAWQQRAKTADSKAYPEDQYLQSGTAEINIPFTEAAACQQVGYDLFGIDLSVWGSALPVVVGAVDLRQHAVGRAGDVSFWVQDSTASGCTVCARRRLAKLSASAESPPGIVYETTLAVNWLATGRMANGVIKGAGQAQQGRWVVLNHEKGIFRACAMLAPFRADLTDIEMLVAPVVSTTNMGLVVDSTSVIGAEVCSTATYFHRSLRPPGAMRWNWVLVKKGSMAV
jgi:hypothetical protein